MFCVCVWGLLSQRGSDSDDLLPEGKCSEPEACSYVSASALTLAVISADELKAEDLLQIRTHA